MAQLKTDIHVNAPPDATFAIFSDLTKMEQRLSGVTKIEMLTDGPIGAGSKWRETRIMFGREATEEMIISEYNPASHYSVTADSHGVAYATRFDFTPDDGGTRVSMTFSATPVSFFAKVMSVFSGAMMGPLKKALDQDMTDLKSAAEDQAKSGGSA